MPTIHPATRRDALSILELQKRAYESEARLYNDWTIPPLTQSLDSLIEEIESITVLKAVAAEALVGSVRARLRDGACEIGRLIVEPRLQGQGIGSALLRAIEAAFPAAECFELFTGAKSERNIRLYSRYGYRVAVTKQLSALVSVVVMRKRAPGGG